MDVDKILLFENQFSKSLYPFSIMHPAWELRCGALRIFEKYQKKFPNANLIFHGRPEQTKSFLKRYNFETQEIKKESILIINSQILPDNKFWNNIDSAYSEFLSSNPVSKSVSFIFQNVTLAIYLPKEEIINPGNNDFDFLIQLLSDFRNIFPSVEINKPEMINFLWDAIYLNGEAITDDFNYFSNHADFELLDKNHVYAINKDKIKIGKNCKIYPGVVLNAEDGPVIIGENVKILPNSFITGPVFIGDNCLVKAGAKIYGKTSIGEWCKVGGEIENSIIQSYSNKQHEGFLGHSFISEWVNLGADTNTSDLKNTYQNIQVNFDGQIIDSEKMFLGLLCGDHTKSAINTSFTTGTTAGIAGIIVSDGFLPNFIPSFAWRGTKGCATYKFEKAIETTRIVMNRRNKNLIDEEIELMKIEFEKLNK